MKLLYGVYPQWESAIVLFSEESDARALASKLNAMKGEEYYGVDVHHLDPTWEEFLETNPSCTQEAFDRRKEYERDVERFRQMY